MGPKMTKPDFAQVWTPLGLTAKEAAVRGEHHFLAIARLKSGVTVMGAQVEIGTRSRKILNSLIPRMTKAGARLFALCAKKQLVKFVLRCS